MITENIDRLVVKLEGGFSSVLARHGVGGSVQFLVYEEDDEWTVAVDLDVSDTDRAETEAITVSFLRKLGLEEIEVAEVPDMRGVRLYSKASSAKIDKLCEHVG